MPTDDPRLEQALHDAAPASSTTAGVRRPRSRASAPGGGATAGSRPAAAVVAVLLVVGTATVLVTRDDGSSPHVAVPPAAISTARGDRGDGSGRRRRSGKGVTPTRPVMLDPRPRTLRAPLLVGTATAVGRRATTSDANGVAAFAGRAHRRRDRWSTSRDFKAQVISITEGEGARWALTRNPRATDGSVPDTFLKRIGPVGDPVSHQLPIDADPVGPIAAVGGAVWVPVRDGVVQFDAADGHLVRHLALPAAAHRWVALSGKGAYVTDGGALRRLDPALGLADRIDLGPEIIGLAARGFDARVLLRNEQGGTDRPRVAAAFEADPVHVGATLPAGFHADGLESSATRMWATGTVDGAPAIVLLDDAGVHATVVFDNAPQATLVWSGPHTVTACRERQVVRDSRALGNHRRPANVDVTSDTQRRPRGDASCGSRR